MKFDAFFVISFQFYRFVLSLFCPRFVSSLLYLPARPLCLIYILFTHCISSSTWCVPFC